MTSFSLCNILAWYFLFILVLGGRENRVHSAIIFIASMLLVVFELPESTNTSEYVFNRGVNILWDSATMLILVAFLFFDKTAWKQALLLAFAVTCHGMIVYDLTIASSLVSSFFYSYYDELIITVGITQMMVSHDGLITALGNLREFVSGLGIYNRSSAKGIALSVKGGKRS